MPSSKEQPRKVLRWRAVVTYRHETGPADVEYHLEELFDLHDLVEHGPHWDTIENIRIERINHVDSPTLTVEHARTL